MNYTGFSFTVFKDLYYVIDWIDCIKNNGVVLSNLKINDNITGYSISGYFLNNSNIDITSCLRKNMMMISKDFDYNPFYTGPIFEYKTNNKDLNDVLRLIKFCKDNNIQVNSLTFDNNKLLFSVYLEEGNANIFMNDFNRDYFLISRII